MISTTIFTHLVTAGISDSAFIIDSVQLINVCCFWCYYYYHAIFQFNTV